jgi:hypothetical protein
MWLLSPSSSSSKWVEEGGATKYRGSPSVTGRQPLLLGTIEKLVSPLLSLVSGFAMVAKPEINCDSYKGPGSLFHACSSGLAIPV